MTSKPARPLALPSTVVAQVASLQSDLQDAITDLQEAYGARSQRWHDGDEGAQTAAWLDTLQTLADDLENLDAQP